MFARLFSNNTNIQTAYSEISRVITGNIINPANLTAFNPSTSIIINSQPSNWFEYTTIGANNLVTAGSVIWFRQRNKSGRWKYAGLSRTSTPATAHQGLFKHYIGDSPSVQTTNTGTATNYSEVYGASTEYAIGAGRGYLVIATRLTGNLYFTDVHMWLEYPEAPMGTFYSLPNQVMYRHYTTGATYATNSSTDLNFSTGIIECAPDGNAGVSILRGGMASPSTQHSTMKPNYYTTFANTVATSGGPTLAYPVVPLFTISSYQGHLDCSRLSGVFGAGHSITTYGSKVIVDGREYVFLKANGCLSYLVPNS